LLCSIPAFRALKQAFPDGEITLIGLPWARSFVERVPYVDRLLIFQGYPGIMEVPYVPEQTAGFLQEAHATGYDIAIQMHGDGNISNGFVADLHAKLSLGYARVVDARLTRCLPFDPEEHEVLRWLRLLGELGIEATDTRIDFPVTRAEQRRARALLQAATPHVGSSTGPLIGLHPGAKAAERRWPPRRFAALADRLVEECNARIVLTGADSERPLTTAVRQAMRYEPLDLTGQTDLGEFAAVIGQLDLLVTNDTGASHVAAATATRSVVLFGLSRPDGWAPLDRQRHRVVDALEWAPAGTDPVEALRRLPVRVVQRACVEMLAPVERSVGGAGGRAARSVAATNKLLVEK
jgi:ADP-heptose:LPS heptosyltransferase